MAERKQKIKIHIVKIILVCLIGGFLSLIAHEMVHVIMHWGHVSHVYIFPNPWTLVQVATDLPPGYDIVGEEIVAYTITFIVIVFTAVAALKIYDDSDERSPAEILFPDDPELQKINPTQLWKESGMDIILPEKLPKDSKQKTKHQ